MPLTDRAIAGVKPKDKPYKLFDERGLFLLVSPAGGRWWRLKYSLGGREKSISLGTYPDTSLRRAREKRDDARKLIADGIDPSATRKAERAQHANDFETIAQLVLERDRKSEAPSTHEKKVAWCATHIYPFIGSKPIAQINAQDVLNVLERIQRRGAVETAHRCRAFVRNVFEFAIVKGLIGANPVTALRRSLAPVVTRNRSAITAPARFGDLLRSIDLYVGQPATQAALRIMPHVFVRSIELRGALWGEFTLDDDDPLWRIPPARMKSGEEHLVPLSKQVVEILREIQPFSDRGPTSLVFPSLRPGRPLSENTLLLAIRQLGYGKDEMSVHGFRSSASTMLNEKGFSPESIELQLAHVDETVRAVYNRSPRIAERRKMLQAWSDYLDALKRGADVVPIRKAPAK